MEQDSKRGRNMKVCLVGSSGGHLTHLYMLKPFWENKKRFWVTFDKEDAKSMLKGEKVYPCYFPTNRNIKKLMGKKLIYIEVFDRIDKPTLTGKLVYPIVDEFIVQWDEMKKVYPKAINLGSIF